MPDPTPTDADGFTPENRLELLLGQIMLREGLVTEGQLEDALRQQGRAGADRPPLGRILVDLGACTADQLTIAVLKQYALLSAAEIVAPEAEPAL